MSQLFDALGRAGTPVPRPGSTAEASHDVGLAGLEQVPCFQPSSAENNRLVSLDDLQNIAAEKVHMLALRLSQAQREKQLKTLLITSSVKDEGKSVVAANLAISLSRTKQRVLLLDGDCHQSTLARLLGAPELDGIEGWWRTSYPVTNFIVKMNSLPLWFLAAGKPIDHTQEMLQSRRLVDMLKQLTSAFDWIIVDSPPLAPLADASAWMGLTDATLLIVRIRRAPTKVLSKIMDSIDKRKLIGLVVNDCADHHISYYEQYYKNFQPTQRSAAETILGGPRWPKRP
jgi:capsular exopolysaccharide synthesis family protein